MFQNISPVPSPYPRSCTSWTVCHKAVLYKVNNKLYLRNKNKGNGMISEVKLLCTKTHEVQLRGYGII